jgi:hypothetical protein
MAVSGERFLKKASSVPERIPCSNASENRELARISGDRDLTLQIERKGRLGLPK